MQNVSYKRCQAYFSSVQNTIPGICLRVSLIILHESTQADRILCIGACSKTFSSTKTETLTLNILGKSFSRGYFETHFFFYFHQQTGIGISCKLSPYPRKTICMKCQCQFSEENKKNNGQSAQNANVCFLEKKNKKNISNLSSAKLALRVAKVN